jgi:hypothetical protein
LLAWERWEGFWVAGVHRGAVRRAFDGEVLTTRVAFEDGSGCLFASESLIRLTAGGETWHAFRYRQEPGGVSAGARRDEAELGADTLPASGEYLLVSQLAASCRERAAYQRVEEVAPAELPAPAEIRRCPAEPIDLPDGSSVWAERFDVTAGGVRVASHWTHHGAVVRSAWAGALCFASRSDGEALAGTDGRLGVFLACGFQRD